MITTTALINIDTYMHFFYIVNKIINNAVINFKVYKVFCFKDEIFIKDIKKIFFILIYYSFKRKKV